MHGAARRPWAGSGCARTREDKQPEPTKAACHLVFLRIPRAERGAARVIGLLPFSRSPVYSGRRGR
jgi:hypothetical protein